MVSGGRRSPCWGGPNPRREVKSVGSGMPSSFRHFPDPTGHREGAIPVGSIAVLCAGGCIHARDLLDGRWRVRGRMLRSIATRHGFSTPSRTPKAKADTTIGPSSRSTRRRLRCSGTEPGRTRIPAPAEAGSAGPDLLGSGPPGGSGAPRPLSPGPRWRRI